MQRESRVKRVSRKDEGFDKGFQSLRLAPLSSGDEDDGRFEVDKGCPGGHGHMFLKKHCQIVNTGLQE